MSGRSQTVGLSGYTAEVDSNGNQLVVLSGSNVKAAGTATAGTSDNSITTTGFNHISVSNDDSTNSITFAIDAVSTSGSKLIVVKAGETFEDQISGTVLHYSCTAGTPSFRYVLR